MAASERTLPSLLTLNDFPLAAGRSPVCIAVYLTQGFGSSEVIQTLQGPVSSVAKPILGSKYSF